MNEHARPDHAGLLDALDGVWQGVLALLADVPAELWERPTGCPGWTVRDQVSHMVWSARTLLGLPPADADVSGLDHVRGPVAEFMERDVEARRARPGADVLAELAAHAGDAVAHARQAGPDHVITGPMGMQLPLGRMLPTSLFDQWLHAEDVRAALGEPGDLDSAAADHAFGVVAGALAAKAEGPVRIELTGPGARTIDVRPADAPEVEPAATLTLGADDLVTLVAGRDRPAAAPAVSGDRRIADAVLAALPLTP